MSFNLNKYDQSFKNFNRTSFDGTSVYKSSRTSFATFVYSVMTAGLSLTGAIAFFLVYTPFYATILPYVSLIILGTFGLGMAMSMGMRHFSTSTLSLLFALYSVLKGLFFGALLPIYAAKIGGPMVGLAFLSAAAVFGGAAEYAICH